MAIRLYSALTGSTEFAEYVTWWIRSGLADSDWTSFEVDDKSGYYVGQQFGVMARVPASNTVTDRMREDMPQEITGQVNGAKFGFNLETQRLFDKYTEFTCDQPKICLKRLTPAILKEDLEQDSGCVGGCPACLPPNDFCAKPGPVWVARFSGRACACGVKCPCRCQ